MAYLDPAEATKHIQQSAIDGVKKIFPIKGRTHTLVLKGISVSDQLNADNVTEQHEAKIGGKTWAAPLHGELELVENASGKVVDTKKVKLADIPGMTSRYSYIVGGQEYQIDNQWQLKPGVYARRRNNGDLEARFNVTGKSAFDLLFDPAKKTFSMEYKKAHIPAYPLMKALGVSDDDLERSWGKDVLLANKNAPRTATALEQFYKTSTGQAAPNTETAHKYFMDHMKQSQLTPDVTEITLGKPFAHVTGDALHLASSKLLKVQSGHPEDDRDSLTFKSLRSAGDYLKEQFERSGREIALKVQRQLNSSRAGTVREVVRPDMFTAPVNFVFVKSSISNTAKQINPLDMVSTAMQTTIMGPGGIKSERSITDEAKMINPSHLGFLDPINTPEGCFVPGTEVLTSEGWVFWPDVTKNTRLACLVDGRLEFHEPLALVAAPFSGDLCVLDTDVTNKRANKTLRYAITPNHRVWSRPIEGAGYRITRADKIHGKMRVFQIGHAPYLGDEAITTFSLPHVGIQHNTKNVGPIAINDWAEFLGWFLSEGYVGYDENTNRYQVKLFQSDLPKGKNNCARIEQLLHRLPFACSKVERENHRLCWSLNVKQLASYLIQFGGSYDKFIPEEAFSWPLPARKLLLEGLMLGDGRTSQAREGKIWKNEVYTTTSPRLAAGVERLILSLGHAARVHRFEDKREERYKDVFEVRLYQSPERAVQKRGVPAYSRKKYRGMVYCAEVPGGLVYVRLGDSIGHWSGNSKTGVTLRLPLGAKKEGNTVTIPVFNLKTGATEHISSKTFLTSKVVLPDQVEFKNGKPTPVRETVKMVGVDNKIMEGTMKEADYVMRHPSQLFNLTSNMIPFIQNDSGGRAGMASRHMEQSISLLHREAPLVQVATPSKQDGVDTFEGLMGKQAAHHSPVDGEVVAIHPTHIQVKDASGKVHTVHTYNNFPLNDTKSVMHATPVVKVGDKVKSGGLLADTNYSKDGKLAIGTNLRIAYMPYKGYNFEDGLVISESAAKKLSSVHLHKQSLALDEKMIRSPREFGIKHVGIFTKAQLEGLDKDGVATVGSIVKPGDPLILASSPYEVKDRTGLAALRKSITSQHSDKSVKWDSEHPGEVVSVHKSGDEVHVHVKTIEPMQIGDKLCFDEETEVLTSFGWKSVTALTLNDHICCLEGDSITYMQPTGLHTYATGGRMYRLSTQQVDVLVTENHRLYVAPRDRNFGLHAAVDMFGKRASYKKDGVWGAPVMPDVILPPMQVRAGQGGKGTSVLPARTIKATTYLMLLGMFLSEGSLVDEPNGNYGIEVAQSKPEGVRELEKALNGAGIKYCQHGDKYRIYSKQLLADFRRFGKAKDKYIPDELFQWSKEDLMVLFKWLMWGDGHTKDGRPVTYTTTSKRLADDVQRLCLHVGYAANIKVDPAHTFEQNGRTYSASTRYVVRVVTTKLTPTVNHGHVRRQNTQVEEWVENYERPVYCVTVPSHVLYVRRGGKAYWSGNSNRHGGKGIVTLILPDKEMPHTADKKPVEILFNPTGVGGRMNVGQIIETTAGKIAEKTGKPYIAQNFSPHIADYSEHIKKELKDHGLSDTEKLYDPVTKLPLGDVLVGKQYMMKLVHQVDKKVSARSGMTLPGLDMGEGFDSMTLQPGSGGHAGGQAIGALGMYAMLAHGAKANIREMQTLKSEVVDPETNPVKAWPSQHVAVWKALQEGTPIPTPKPTFAFHRFLQMLRGAGVNVEKKGHELVLGPMTDKHILSMSAGEIPHPNRALQSKTDESGKLKPITGGLFDEKLTGGHGGTKWTHMTLAEPVPNPVFEDAIKRLTGLKGKQFDAVMAGEQGIHPVTGAVTDLKSGLTGGHGIKKLLEKIDVDKDLEKAKAALTKAKPADIDASLKKVKYLQALKTLDMKPADAYVLHHMPILPPSIRPIAAMEGKALRYEDINGLYMQLAQVNQQLKDPTLSANLTEAKKSGLRAALYDGVKAVTGVTAPENAKQKGLLEVISGTTPKASYFQDSLINRRQDLSARSTIIPESSLGLDELGLPRDMATKLFAPFVVRQLVSQGSAANTLVAQKMLADHIKGTAPTTLVTSALDRVLTERPVLLKRDPVLHKYGIQAFKPKAVDGSAIRIHPLVTGGFNADFDGDAMAVFVPMTHDAVREAHGMFPSKNLLNEATGKVMYVPTLDSALGLYKLSRTGKETTHSFTSNAAIAQALHANKIEPTDVVTLNGRKTTAGRVLIAEEAPPSMKEKILHDLTFVIDKKGLGTIYTQLADDKHRHEFGKYADKLKTLGFDASYGVVKSSLVPGGHVAVGTHSLSLNDFTTDKKNRDAVMAEAHKEVAKIKATSGVSEAAKDRQIANVYLNAGATLDTVHKEEIKKNPSNLFLMTSAGIKPSWDQYKQMAIAPVIVTDSKNRPVPTPILKSYSEGLDTAGYWTQMAGARRGAVMKVQEVQEPGYMSKLLMNSSMHLMIDKHDCGTTKGISMSVTDKDLHDRHLATDFKAGSIHFPAGTALTQTVVDQIRAADKDAKLLVRSSLKCESEKGICQKCAGLSVSGHHHPLGTNIGILSSQAIGERAVQLTLKAFHTGGAVESGGGSKALNSFGRFEQLTKLHEKIPDSATLAMKSGTITRVDQGSTGVTVHIDGTPHFIGKDSAGVALHEPLKDHHKIQGYKPWEPPKVGMHVTAGSVLSDPNRTVVNPHDLYAATKSMDKVQNHLTSEIHSLYESEGVRRRAVEVLVKAMSNLTKVDDPGDHPDILRGEFYPTTYVQSLNNNVLKGKRPVQHTPVLKGVDMLPLSLTTDWMAKLQHQRLKETLLTSAAAGYGSSIHGPHPIPAAAYGAEFGLGHLAKQQPGKPEVKPFHY